MSDYDVIVLGGGSAGTAAAREASRGGARTAMVNDGELGGLCILRGCMPSKAMLASAHAVHEARHLDGLGATLDGRIVPDFQRIMARKDAQVARFQRAKIASIEEQPYEVIRGRARFAAGGGVEVGGRRLDARRYVIATGSVPVLPPIEGLDGVGVWTSDDVMRLASPPSSLIVLGSGAIGLEMAQFFARIGTDVLLISRSPLLARFDPEAGAELAAALGEEQDLRLAVGARIERVRASGAGLVARVLEGERTAEHEAEALLVATGRRAALDDLGLEHVGLAPKDGRLEHDEHMRTANPDVFVAGDATGRYQLLHLANQEAAVAGRNAAAERPRERMDYRLKMSVIFTDPPYAQVGITSPEAEAAGERVVTGTARFPETGRAITMGARHGLWKLYIERDGCEILGASILGPRADDLVHLISVMMHFRAQAQVIAQLPWYHPTLAEVILNVERDLARQLEACPEPVMPPA